MKRLLLLFVLITPLAAQAQWDLELDSIQAALYSSNPQDNPRFYQLIEQAGWRAKSEEKLDPNQSRLMASNQYQTIWEYPNTECPDCAASQLVTTSFFGDRKNGIPASFAIWPINSDTLQVKEMLRLPMTSPIVMNDSLVYYFAVQDTWGLKWKTKVGERGKEIRIELFATEPGWSSH